MSLPPVRRTIEIEASQARCFRVFTEEHGLWWPLASHHIGEQEAQTAIIEPHAGGRWFERAADGTECDWGRVLTWDPPARLVLAWQIGAGWKVDPALMTVVDIRFVAVGPARTRVELEHSGLEQYGAAAEQMRAIFGSDNGWGAILGHFARRTTG